MKLNPVRTFITALVALALFALGAAGVLSPQGAFAIGLLLVGGAEFAFAARASAPRGLALGAISPQFLFDFESNMQAIQENEYLRLTQDLWWSKIARLRPSGSKRERINFLLSTAMIRSEGSGGNKQFDDLVQMTKEYVSRNSGAGFSVTRDQLEDLDGGGLDLAGQWSRDIGAYMAYWPQKQVIKAILNGEAATSLAYDGQPFFSGWDGTKHTGKHPYNPYNTALGGYANLLTGASDSGAGYLYPGACPIDDSVTTDVALVNLSKVISYIRTIKMPNGEDPRKLKAVGIYAPPRMTLRVQQLTNAKFIAQAAATGGGSADIEFAVRNWGLVQPTEVDEFAGNFSYQLDLEDGGGTVSGDDKTWYLACEQLASSQLGALTYVDREPYEVQMFGDLAYPELMRRRKLEYDCRGRNVTGYGQPFLLFKIKAT